MTSFMGALSAVRNEGGFFFRKLTGHCWRTSIIPNLDLGALPLDEHLYGLINDQVIRILSINERSELEPNVTFAYAPISERTFANNNIVRKVCEIVDNNAISDEVFKESILEINTAISKGNRILVHCRIGIGRSASVVIAYVMFMEPEWSYEQAFKFVKLKRPEISPHPWQADAIKDFVFRERDGEWAKGLHHHRIE